MSYRRVATFTGWLWLITFVTSIPVRLFFYAPVLEEEGNYVTGAGGDAQTLIAIGAVLELALIISNVGTAVVPYSIHQRVHEAGAVAYVTARVVECGFIAIGIVCMLAISSLRGDRHLSHRQGLPDLVAGPGGDPGGRTRLARPRLNVARPRLSPQSAL
jgi:Domain of unknown function (DUF4386)